MEAHLPGRDECANGPAEIVARFAAWWPTPGRLTAWQATPAGSGAIVEFERQAGSDLWRQIHYLHRANERITRQYVYCMRPQAAIRLPVASEPTSLLGEAVERVPLAHGGFSGGILERVRLADGRWLVLKHIAPATNWLMRATHDRGREAELWTSGALARLPVAIAWPILAVESAGDGWRLFMRDISPWLIPAAAVLSREDSRRILRAAHALHETFRGERIPGLCSLADRYALLSPATAARERQGNDTLIKHAARGWERFADRAPADVAPAIFKLLDQPRRLAEQLECHETTLIHGDLKPGNIGFPPEPGRILLFDWELACQAPPAVELTYYLSLTCAWPPWWRSAASREELIDDYRAIAGAHFDERALQLALLGQLVIHGGRKALFSGEHPDEAVRQRFAADLDWWVRRARQTLETTWSPV